jgi:hypothetical protein
MATREIKSLKTRCVGSLLRKVYRALRLTCGTRCGDNPYCYYIYHKTLQVTVPVKTQRQKIQCSELSNLAVTARAMAGIILPLYSGEVAFLLGLFQEVE